MKKWYHVFTLMSNTNEYKEVARFISKSEAKSYMELMRNYPAYITHKNKLVFHQNLIT